MRTFQNNSLLSLHLSGSSNLLKKHRNDKSYYKMFTLFDGQLLRSNRLVWYFSILKLSVKPESFLAKQYVLALYLNLKLSFFIHINFPFIPVKLNNPNIIIITTKNNKLKEVEKKNRTKNLF